MENDAANITIGIAADEVSGESSDITIDDVPVESEEIVIEEVPDEAQGIWSSSSGDESNAELNSTSACSSVDTAILDSADTTALDSAVGSSIEPAFKYSYGVFLGYEGKISKLRDYETVVIDVQSTYFTKKDIKAFKQRGHKVYSYINVGALENTRDYYKKYKGLALGKYEHWDEEVWIDVSKSKWQKFILKELAPMMLDKGIDGFFVDNCDVYYNYPRKKIYNGLTVIMKGLIATGKKVIINGGDCYLDKYCKKTEYDYYISGSLGLTFS